MHLVPGSDVPARELTPVGGPPVPVPDPAHLVHLQFRRFAGCPICNLHLRSFVTRHADIEAAGIREIVVFHSTEEELREFLKAHIAPFKIPVRFWEVTEPLPRLGTEKVDKRTLRERYTKAFLTG